MKNKLIFRILGALSSTLIIVGVFVPFVSVSGISKSLWDVYSITDTLYLPIMIIIFGAIGVIFFALNIKTEFAYMSTGAITFFIVMQTIDVVDQKMFNTFSMGYYFLASGAILTGIMAFLCNLKIKTKTLKAEIQTVPNHDSMLQQIDNLYSDQQISLQPDIQQVSNEIGPIQPMQLVQPIQPVQPINLQTNGFDTQSVPQPLSSISEATSTNENQQNSVIEQIPVQPTNPVVQELNSAQPTAVEPSSSSSVQPTNPVVQEFTSSQPTAVESASSASVQPTNPVLQEFTSSQPTAVESASSASVQPTNPVVQELNSPQSTTVEPVSVSVSASQQPTNPVLQEFSNVQQNNNALNSFLPNNTSETQNLESNPNNVSTSSLDIFGQ